MGRLPTDTVHSPHFTIAKNVLARNEENASLEHRRIVQIPYRTIPHYRRRRRRRTIHR